FAELVERHVNKVYSIALRHTRSPHQAEEITQVVFVILARKCRHLGKRVVLSGWLCRTARLTAVTFVRGEVRRAHREQEASVQHLTNETESDLWPKIAPILDEAMSRLNHTDHHAVVLRFFDGKNMREIGEALGSTEDAAKMRVGRAVEKLRLFFANRGVVLPAEALTLMISENSVHAAPPTLAKTAAALALTKGTAASASALSLTKATTKIIAWANLKTTAIVGALIIVAAGTAATVILRGGAAGQVDLPKSSWVFAGYGSPEATLQTILWGVTQPNGKAIVDGLSADCQDDFRQFIATHKNNRGISVDAFFLKMWAPLSSNHAKIRFGNEEYLSPDQIILELSARADKGSKDIWLKFKKIGTDWKIDDFDAKGHNGRTGLEHVNTQYGGIGIALDTEPATHAPRITKVLPDLAQAQTNLVPGLIVQKINGNSTDGKSLSECVFLTRGRVGTDVVLQLYDPQHEQTNIVELTRKQFTWQDMIKLGIR
ncbi:MAG TPA: sigma-70 family RNA polymerase sigma factor, partial [Verrucomicrobiae bacterium]|nr:sigma-70 family RNA polymerase sigma factor [Verrucomicrobiae bacterium]